MVIRKNFIIEPFGKIRVYLGKGVVIKESVIIRGYGNLVIKDNTHIGSYSLIGVNGDMTIGENCMIADYVSLRDSNHIFSNMNIPMNQQGIIVKDITIENDVWLGHGSIILPGVCVGEGAIIGAGSVVTKNVRDFSVMAGNPATLISDRSEKK